MRALVIVLAILAGIKVWYQDTMYRDAADRAVTAAYLAPATAACQKLPQPGPVRWTALDSYHLSAGNRDVPVKIWQVDHPLWNARFKNPYLILKSAESEHLACAYDVVSGQATLTRS